MMFVGVVFKLFILKFTLIQVTDTTSELGFGKQLNTYLTPVVGLVSKNTKSKNVTITVSYINFKYNTFNTFHHSCSSVSVKGR